MKKLLISLSIVSISAVCFAGLISHSDYATGGTITASAQNSNENTIVNEFNGNIESANIKDGTIVAADIADATITSGKLSTTVQTQLSAIALVAVYRRPTLQYNTTGVVNIESGLDGTSGDVTILFPDGSVRTDNSTTRTRCTLTQNSALTGSVKGGIRSGSVANNTWYALYAVKSQANTTDLVCVADTVLPLQANYATLNSNFGTQSWIYLGLVVTGSSANVQQFVQAGNTTILTGDGLSYLSQTSSSVTYTYAAGTTALTQVPSNVGFLSWVAGTTSANNVDVSIQSSAANTVYAKTRPVNASGGTRWQIFMPASSGINITCGGSETMFAFLKGWVDTSLGIGSNPLL